MSGSELTLGLAGTRCCQVVTLMTVLLLPLLLLLLYVRAGAVVHQ
jgi:hypothetical protein